MTCITNKEEIARS